MADFKNIFIFSGIIRSSQSTLTHHDFLIPSIVVDQHNHGLLESYIQKVPHPGEFKNSIIDYIVIV